MKRSILNNTIFPVMAMAFSGFALADAVAMKTVPDKLTEKHDQLISSSYEREGDKCDQTSRFAKSNEVTVLYCSSTGVWRSEQPSTINEVAARFEYGEKNLKKRMKAAIRSSFLLFGISIG